MIGNCARFTSRLGATSLVVTRSVIGSTASVLATDPRYSVNGDGLFGTLGTRSYVNTTSSAVNGVPSENFTPGRSLNVHTLPSTVQDSASAGTGLSWASVATSVSKMVWEICVFGVRAWYCGSIDDGSVFRAITRSRASAELKVPKASITAAEPQANARENRYAIVISLSCFGF